MLIKKININNAATFKNFSQDFDFAKRNIFFGYNGCGKTTLSRILDSLAKKTIVPAIENSVFKIQTSDSTYDHNTLDSEIKIKVFNQDYMQENIHYDNLSGVFIAGKESYTKQEELKILINQKDKLMELKNTKTQELKSSANNIQKLNESLEQEKSNTARSVKDSLPGYDASYNKKKLDEFRTSDIFKKYEVEIIDIDKEIITHNAPNKENINFSPIFREVSPDLLQSINNILQSSVLDSIKISSITSDNEGWIRIGMQLHEHSDTCLFCGSEITEERKETLNSHFSDAYQKLILDIDETIKKITQFKNDALTQHFDWQESLKEEGKEVYKQLNEDIKTYNQKIDDITEILEKKKKNIFDTSLNISTTHLFIPTTNLLKLIRQHQEIYNNFEKEKEVAVQNVITYKIIELEKSQKYLDIQNSILKAKLTQGEIQKTLDSISPKIGELNDKITNLKREIHTLQIGAEKFNQYLSELLPSLSLTVETRGNNFVLMRNSQPVNYLSEGERNILSFVYFVLSFSNGQHYSNLLADDVKEWIVCIDDPMSSLDDSNLHLIAGFIKKHFKYAKQLFLTTHNFPFWRCFRNKRGQDSFYNHFLIDKVGGNSSTTSLDNSHPLVKHQSDYTFIYSKLKQYIENPDIENNVQILNLLRKFLEHFVSFMYPNNASITELLEILFEGSDHLSPDIENSIIYDMSNEGSHMQTKTDFLAKKPSDIAENVNKVIEAMKSKHPKHIASLDHSPSL